MRGPSALWRTRAAAVAIVAIALAAGWAGLWWSARPATARQQLDRHFAASVSLLQEGRYADAASAVQQVLAIAPQLPEAHVNLGFALLGLGHHTAARQSFDHAIALRADQGNAYYGLALACEGARDMACARGAMRTFVHRAGNDHPHLARARAALWEWQSPVSNDDARRLGLLDRSGKPVAR